MVVGGFLRWDSAASLYVVHVAINWIALLISFPHCFLNWDWLRFGEKVNGSRHLSVLSCTSGHAGKQRSDNDVSALTQHVGCHSDMLQSFNHIRSSWLGTGPFFTADNTVTSTDESVALCG